MKRLVTAEQAKALLDAATPGGWHWIRNTVDGRSTVGWSVGDDASGADIFDCLDSETDIPITSEGNARLIAAAPDLAATVVELEAERDALKQMMWDAWLTLGFDGDGDKTPAAHLNFVDHFLADIKEARADYDEACDENSAMQAAIDKVKAWHVPMGGNFGGSCSCGAVEPCFTREALTQGGEGS